MTNIKRMQLSYFIFSFLHFPFLPALLPLSQIFLFLQKKMNLSDTNTPVTPVRQIVRRVDTPGAPARDRTMRTHTSTFRPLRPTVLFPSAPSTPKTWWWSGPVGIATPTAPARPQRPNHMEEEEEAEEEDATVSRNLFPN